MKYFLIITAFIIASCAQMVPPSGGPKDIMPPQVVEENTVPKNKTVNFNSKTIVISFDEYVKLNNPSENVIISPAMDEKPDYLLKGKKLYIKLKSELKPNTTYTLNFGNCITDITENNPAAGLTYVFSTGAVLDSLRLSGLVTNAFTNAPEKGVWVVLHRNLSDTAFQKMTPDYLTKTDANGFYSLQNLAAGEYQIFALKDGNSDYKYSQPSEEIAFHNNNIIIGEKNDAVNLRLFKEDNEKQFVKGSSYRWPGVITVVMNRKDSTFRSLNFPKDSFLSDGGLIRPLKDSMFYNYYYSANRDTLLIWQYPQEKRPITQLFLEGYKFTDTLLFNKEDLKKGEFKDFKLKTNLKNNFDFRSDITFSHGYPIIDTGAHFILIENGKDTLKTDGDRFRFFEKNPRKIIRHASLKENMEYQLILPYGTFRDMYGQKNIADTIKFTTAKQEYYGSIIATFDLSEGNYLMQITGSGEKIITESPLLIQKRETPQNGGSLHVVGPIGLEIDHFNPGSYKMRIINDQNQNAKWDTGNLSEKKQPERVYYYKEPIMIRSNWDFELTWKIEN